MDRRKDANAQLTLSTIIQSRIHCLGNSAIHSGQDCPTIKINSHGHAHRTSLSKPSLIEITILGDSKVSQIDRGTNHHITPLFFFFNSVSCWVLLVTNYISPQNLILKTRYQLPCSAMPRPEIHVNLDYQPENSKFRQNDRDHRSLHLPLMQPLQRSYL